MKKYLPVISILAALLLQVLLPDSGKQPLAEAPYFTYALAVSLVLYCCLLAASFMRKDVDQAITYRGYFVAGVFLFLNILNLLTLKLAVLPVLYFPSLNRVLGVLVSERLLLLKCLGYSFRLLFYGYFLGAFVGLVTGICIGFSKRFSYWISPLVRVLGPIPSTAWVPLVLVIFPTAVSASAFLVALAVWFPTTVMTSSGISNVRQAYFEVGSTLGASPFDRVFRIGTPAAMPHIFLGLFNGTCASFITLVTAEMIGAKYGIGWYINWQKEMLAYANVYAGLIIIAVVFSILITCLFKFRDKILVWQKGVIKW